MRLRLAPAAWRRENHQRLVCLLLAADEVDGMAAEEALSCAVLVEVALLLRSLTTRTARRWWRRRGTFEAVEDGIVGVESEQSEGSER